MRVCVRRSMINGRISGYGEYYSPIGGEVMKGNFVNGTLSDGDGYHRNQAGEIYEGVSMSECIVGA